MASRLANGMEKYLRERIKQTEQMPLSEIKKLPAYSDEEVKINNKVCTAAIWKNQRTDGMIEVIIQLYYCGLCYRLFGAGTMTADGFLIDSEGEISKLPDEIRWEYC